MCVEQVTHITHAEQTTVSRCSILTDDCVGPFHDGPIAPLRGILSLMKRFRMPSTAVVHSEDVPNFVGNFSLCIISDKFAHSSVNLM